MPVGAKVLTFPTVTADFLWPFNGRRLTRDLSGRDLPGKTSTGSLHPLDFKDAYIDRLVDKEIDTEQAIGKYVAEDINRIIDLDEVLAKTLERQQRLDSVTDFSVAEIITRHLREDALFLQHDRPGMRILRHLATGLFWSAGATRSEILRLEEALSTYVKSLGTLPIHPSIVRHFQLGDLKSASVQRRRTEGESAFEGFVRGYLTAESAYLDLEDAIHFADGGDPEIAIQQLQDALERWPSVAKGHHALGKALASQNQVVEALVAVRRAIDLDPQVALYQGTLSSLLAKNGELEAAIAAGRQVIHLIPSNPHPRAYLQYSSTAKRGIR